jgi:hypothetical protein
MGTGGPFILVIIRQIACEKKAPNNLETHTGVSFSTLFEVKFSTVFGV